LALPNIKILCITNRQGGPQTCTMRQQCLGTTRGSRGLLRQDFYKHQCLHDNDGKMTAGPTDPRRRQDGPVRHPRSRK
jgi:hypothetical protein